MDDMKTSRTLRIARKPNWLGKFRTEYDGKYIALFGEDKNYQGWGYGTTEDSEPWYEEMCFGGSFAEGRNLTPLIVEVDDTHIYVDLGEHRESLAWTKMVDDEKYVNVFEPCDY